jgi:uncharacterized protein (UPF0333 family)
MKNNKGQTLIEFILIFAVLLAASAGVVSMYKSVWKKKYTKMSMSSNILYVSVTGGYVK